MGCPDQDEQNECGRPAYVQAGPYCETHFSYHYPASYERLKREIRCPECNGGQFNCEFCFGRGWMDPKRAIAYAAPEPEPVAAKVAFDPPVEKTLDVDTETGEILGDEGRTFENLGI